MNDPEPGMVDTGGFNVAKHLVCREREGRKDCRYKCFYADSKGSAREGLHQDQRRAAHQRKVHPATQTVLS